MFIIYLAYALGHKSITEEEHCYCRPPEENPIPRIPKSITLDHTYARQTTTISPSEVTTIQPKYADDITYISTSPTVISNIKKTVPQKLVNFNLHINETKTEEYTAPDCPNTETKDSWKKCKLLGSMLDTKEDIKRRKSLVNNAMKKYRNTYKSKYLSMEQKIRHFNMYIQSVMLYNCELWSMNETLNKSIDAFQRRKLRHAINVLWPRKMCNEELYKVTKATPWSKNIENRRFSWLGHLMRLDPDTPAREALKKALKYAPGNRGRPPTTWINVVQKDLLKRRIDINLKDGDAIERLEKLAKDKGHWRAISKLPKERTIVKSS